MGVLIYNGGTHFIQIFASFLQPISIFLINKKRKT